MPDADPKSESPAELIARLESVVGAKGMVTDPADIEPHVTDRRGRYRGRTPCVVKPASTREAAEATVPGPA